MNDQAPTDVVLSVENVTKTYGRRSLLRRTAPVHAVRGVSLELRAGETLAVVGESGCGKSSLANAILQLDKATSGSIRFQGQELTRLSGRQLRPIRRRLQVVFQDPYASLNARQRIGDLVAEPLRIHEPRLTATQRSQRVRELLELVGLDPAIVDWHPTRLSGGQRQRLGIARAIISEPSVVICDEAVSALDVSIQAQVLNLLADLQARLGLAYLFITHDLAVVRQIADRVAVMYLGRIVEIGPVDALIDDPKHPYTRALLDAVPGQGLLPPAQDTTAGEPPSGRSEIAGCPFHPRCPRRDSSDCLTTLPELRPDQGGHYSACHHPLNADSADLAVADR